MVDLKKGFQYGLAVGVTTWLISLLIGFFNIPIVNVTMAAVPIDIRTKLVQGIDTTWAGQLLGGLTGALPFGLGTLALIILAGTLISIVGLYSLGFVKNTLKYSPKSQVGRLALMLTLGSVIVGIVAGAISAGTNLTFVGIIVTLLIYYGIVGFIVMWLGNTFPRLKFLKVPSL